MAYPEKPTKPYQFEALVVERHGFLVGTGITPERDYTYLYVIDAIGWTFHRLWMTEDGQSFGRAFRWMRGSNKEAPAEVAKKWLARWEQAGYKVAVKKTIA